ncbi:efflux transporter outer membrane subunit [Sphingomonas koreensis]|nr:efflux transporter outer membrane subunit [Sphingomonas koreensis]
MRSRYSILFASALPLAACTVGPNYKPATPGQLGVPEGYSVAADQADPRGDFTRWWTAFNDPLLTQLVEQSRTTNLDVAQAVSRLRQAHEALIQSRAELLPSLDASAGYSRNFNLAGGTSTITLPDGTVTSITRSSDNNFSLSGDVSYQVGLFGEIRRTVEASRAQYQGNGYDYATVLTSTESEVARNYILARLYQAQLANAQRSLAIQDDNLEIAGFRVQAGLVSSIDQETARASRAQTAASIPSIQQSYNQAVSRLGVLTGQAPGALKTQMAAAQPIPVGPANVAVGIPADTLRQRPDVRSAERGLAAATAEIGVAKAALYPALNITGNIGTSANVFNDLFKIVTGSLFGGISQAIFNGGRLNAQVRSNEAAAEGAFALYKSTVLTALEDVENAVVALNAAKEREKQYAIAYDASNNSAILSRSQYRAGLTDFTTLNTAESSLISARNGLTQAKSDEVTALVQLYLALGGGWDSGTVPVEPVTAPVVPTSQTAQEP